MSVAETVVLHPCFQMCMAEPKIHGENHLYRIIYVEMVLWISSNKKRNDWVTFFYSVVTLTSCYFPSSWNNSGTTLLGETLQFVK